MPPSRKRDDPSKKIPDPYINNLIEELIGLQNEERDQMEFSQRVGKTGSFMWDLRNGTSQWTKGFELLYGFENGGFKGGTTKAWLKYIHPDDQDRVIAETEEALKDENEINVEFRVIWPNKSIHHLLTRARIIRDGNGKPLEVRGINIDISERKQIEANLQYLAEASKILASSLDYNKTLKSIVKLGAPQIADWCAVDMLTEDNKIQRIEIAHIDPKKVKWAWELQELSPSSMESNSGLAKVLKTGKSEFYPIITDEMIAASSTTPEQLELMRKINFKSIMIVPLIVEGRAVGALTFVSSESNRHFTKSDLTTAEEVASRAALAIHNSRLFTDSQNAIAIRDEFISVASHELKTPVTSLKMYTEIIMKQLEQRGEKVLLNPLGKMHAQIDKLTLLINDLLNISKIQLGKLEFNEETFDFQQLVEDTVESVQAGSPNHKIIIEGTATKKVWGDKDRLGQVITNLLTNAIKYSPHADKVKVKITEKPKEISVTVIDYGIGIDKEQQKKIFNRFYRVAGHEEKTFPGLGIGLYISAEIIKRHNGRISVKSAKGRGSEFCVTIPSTKPRVKKK